MSIGPTITTATPFIIMGLYMLRGYLMLNDKFYISSDFMNPIYFLSYGIVAVGLVLTVASIPLFIIGSLYSNKYKKLSKISILREYLLMNQLNSLCIKF